MLIVNNTAENYKECLNITKPTWKLPQQLFSFEAQNFNGHCTNKIHATKQAIKDNQGQNLIYLDTDVLMLRDIKDIFTHDIITTRMVNRPNRPHYHEVNAGVFFMRANQKTLKFCDEWLELDKEYQKDPSIPYPEQRAFNDLCYKYYDSESELTVSNISENIYNFERDDDKQFIQDVIKYKPIFIHLKNKKWKNEFIVNFLRTNNLLNN